MVASYMIGVPSGVVHDRGTDQDGGVGTDEDTEAEGHGQTADGLTAEDRDGEHREEGGHGGVHRTGEGGVQSRIDSLAEVGVRVQALLLTDTVEDNHVIVDGVTDLLLTDTVEDNHVIVDGVTDDGQDGRDERLVHIQVERQDPVEQGEEADHDEGRVGEGDHAAETPGPALEPPGDVGR